MKLKIMAKWSVEIPDEAEILVKTGQEVEEGEKLLNFKSREIRFFDASLVLGKIGGDKLSQFGDKWKGVKVKEGEVLMETGGLFSKKILSPVEGIFEGIDEFQNIHFEIGSNEVKAIISPVKAVVEKIEKDKLVLEFEVSEYEGEVLIEGKVWGTMKDGEIDKLPDLNSSYEGEIILTTKLNQALVIKAEVVGVLGIVTNTKEEISDKINTSLPILRLDEKVFGSLREELSLGKRKVLLNSTKGRLLLVK